MVSNTESWERLAQKGELYAYLKDGLPHEWWQVVLGYSYPIAMIAITILSVVLYMKLSGEKKRWKSMLFGVGYGTIAGWIWGYLMLNWTGDFPGWVFPTWAVTGIECILPLEDILFYPFCTLLFYVIYRSVRSFDNSWDKPWVFNTIILFYIAVIGFYLFNTSVCGKAVSLMFAIPGLALFIYARDRVTVKRFLSFQVILILINTLWDWWAVSWMHALPNMAWASQWVYVSFDQFGNHFQSPIFLDYKEYPWAWIFHNPIEGTPWMGIAGGLLNYSLFCAGDKMFYNKEI